MNPNPITDSAYGPLLGIMGLVWVLALAMSISGFIFAMLTMLATRRTARATEQLAAQVAEIKARLSNDQS